MEVLDNLTFISVNLFLLFCSINCQATQCNIQEYMSIVHNLESLRAQVTKLKAELEDVKIREATNLEALQSILNNTNSEVISLKANNSAIESSIATLSGRVDSEISSLENKDSTIESYVRNIKETLSTDVENLKSVDTDIQSSIDHIKNINIIALQTRDTILQSTLDQVQTNIGELQSVQEDHKSNITILAEKGIQLESFVNSNDQSITTMNSTIMALSNKLDTIETAVPSMEP